MTISRRRLLYAAGAVVSTQFVVAGTSAYATLGSSLSQSELAVLIRVAKLGAVFPRPFPQIEGVAAPAARIRTAAQIVTTLPAERLSAVRRGAWLLGPQVGATDQELLAALVSGADPVSITALVALAAHLVYEPADPRRDDGAQVWLAAVKRLRGTAIGATR
ncbi:hypothetical protein OG474_39180 [Kribbella sp. NBC_01505]|uniref:hypothetical protein n=1 Tax=Kribbella sp. NBC_01505 TaxID=2903580 RepID=UPI003867EDD5